jgi:ABC-2 type transport system ATP-binding protein
MAEPILEVRDIHKCYGANAALQGISFSVAHGEMFGLLGPNGAGKTTLLSIISCLLSASSGEVRVLGRPLVPQETELRRLIGIVPQELALYNELTARENLTFFGRLYGLHDVDLRQRVDEVLAAIQLEDRADRRVDTFSGGMKRRLNLGAGIIHRPRLLLLDEPTAGVDPQSRNHIFSEIRRVNAEGVTVIYTSHYMEEVQSLCPRIGIIDRGQLIACDAIEELLRRLEGRIRFRTDNVPPELPSRIRDLFGIPLVESNGHPLELACRDVRSTLLQLLQILGDLNLKLVHLETQEPNLESVFLALTGHALRDD